MIDITKFDARGFISSPFFQKIETPWGYELHFTPEDVSYSGKLIHIKAGNRLPMEVHDRKQETFLLLSGACNLVCDNTSRDIQEISMDKLRGYTVAIGQRHRLTALTDSDIFEVSTQNIGETDALDSP